MKIKFCLLTALLLGASRLAAAVLSAPAAVHTQADEASPVIAYLKAGTTVAAAANPSATAPAGWMAVDTNTPFEAFVANRDINKSLDVRPGSVFRTAPKAEAPTLATMEPGDQVKITGLKGKWTQVMVTKHLVAYIKVSAVSASAPVPAPLASAPAPKPAAAPVAAPVAAASSGPIPAPLPPSQEPIPAPLSPAPVQPVAWGSAPTGQPVPMVDRGDGGSSALPRSYSGKFVSSRRPFAPKRPYDFQINDDANVRFAYLDLSKLMLTDTLDKFLDRPVSVYGTARNMPGTKDIVIEVESMVLR